MSVYVDYNYYLNTYQGKVKEEVFSILEIKASGILNYYTFNRIKEVDDDIKLTVCELIDNIEQLEKLESEGKGITQEKVGSYSVSYANSDIKRKELKQEQKQIIFRYLGYTGLLYRGG